MVDKGKIILAFGDDFVRERELPKREKQELLAKPQLSFEELVEKFSGDIDATELGRNIVEHYEAIRLFNDEQLESFVLCSVYSLTNLRGRENVVANEAKEKGVPFTPIDIKEETVIKYFKKYRKEIATLSRTNSGINYRIGSQLRTISADNLTALLNEYNGVAALIDIATFFNDVNQIMFFKMADALDKEELEGDIMGYGIKSSNIANRLTLSLDTRSNFIWKSAKGNITKLIKYCYAGDFSGETFYTRRSIDIVNAEWANNENKLKQFFKYSGRVDTNVLSLLGQSDELLKYFVTFSLGSYKRNEINIGTNVDVFKTIVEANHNTLSKFNLDKFEDDDYLFNLYETVVNKPNTNTNRYITRTGHDLNISDFKSLHVINDTATIKRFAKLILLDEEVNGGNYEDRPYEQRLPYDLISTIARKIAFADDVIEYIDFIKEGFTLLNKRVLQGQSWRYHSATLATAVFKELRNCIMLSFRNRTTNYRQLLNVLVALIPTFKSIELRRIEKFSSMLLQDMYEIEETYIKHVIAGQLIPQFIEADKLAYEKISEMYALLITLDKQSRVIYDSTYAYRKLNENVVKYDLYLATNDVKLVETPFIFRIAEHCSEILENFTENDIEDFSWAHTRQADIKAERKLVYEAYIEFFKQYV